MKSLFRRNNILLKKIFNKKIDQKVTSLEPSATLVINEKTRNSIQQGKNIFKFGFGQSPFPVPELLVKELQKNAYQKDYLDVKGLKPLRQSIADFHNENYKTDEKYTYEDIIIGPGSKELMFILQMVYEAPLYLPQNSWVSYGPQSQLNGRKINWINSKISDSYKLNLKEFQKMTESDESEKLVILNNPCNPTGACYSAKELKNLAEYFRKTNTLVISDEIYGLLHHDSNHQSINKFYAEGTIISGGISKWMGAGGWRLGYLVFPPNLRELLNFCATVASETYTSVSSPIQYAAIKAFRQENDKEKKEIENYLTHSRLVLKELGKYVHQSLTDGTGIKCAKPEGGFYVAPDFSSHKGIRKRFKTSKEMCEALVEESSVALLPGSAFGRPKEELSTRLAYVHFDGQKVLKEMAKGEKLDEKFIKQHCSNVVDGIESIKNWVSSHS